SSIASSSPRWPTPGASVTVPAACADRPGSRDRPRDRIPAMTARGSLVSLAAVLLLVGDPRLAAAPYPLFDAPIHYSRPHWDAYPPERALAIPAQAGVRRASVPSTPDGGLPSAYHGR